MPSLPMQFRPVPSRTTTVTPPAPMPPPPTPEPGPASLAITPPLTAAPPPAVDETPVPKRSPRKVPQPRARGRQTKATGRFPTGEPRVSLTGWQVSPSRVARDLGLR